MPPSTITEISVIDKPALMNCENYKLDHEVKGYINEEKDINNSENNDDVCPYESSLPRNESKYFSRLRNWEKEKGFVTSLRWINVVAIILFHVVTSVWVIMGVSTGTIPKWQTGLFGNYITSLLL